MCGIAGGFGFGIDRLRIMSSANDSLMKRRGPDELIQYSNIYSCIYMRRLAIVRKKPQIEPFVSSDKRYKVIFNGEIYNYKSIAKSNNLIIDNDKSDGQIIPDLYAKMGNYFFNQIDGPFVIAIIDELSKKLILARDGNGEKPLYFSHSKDGIYFSSILSSFKYFHDDLKINTQAIYDYLSFLWVPEPEVLFGGIKILDPGSILEFSLDKNSPRIINKEHQSILAFKGSYEDACTTLRNLMHDSVSERVDCDANVGSFLSGGLDSSIVTQEVACLSKRKIKTFCMDFSDQLTSTINETDVSESARASKTAKLLGTDHSTIVMTQEKFDHHLNELVNSDSELMSVSSGLGVKVICQEAKSIGIDVLLSGDCADEMFGGYYWYQFLEMLSNKSDLKSLEINYLDSNLNNLFDKITNSEKLKLYGNLNYQSKILASHYYASENIKLSFLNKEFAKKQKNSSRYFLPDDAKKEFTVMDLLDSDRKFYLKNEMLRKVDRMSMFESVEVRLPFLSKNLVSFAYSLPKNYLFDEKITKKIFRDAYTGILDSDLLSRPKHGFSFPIKSWLTNQYREELYHLFSPNSSLVRMGVLNSISSIKKIDEHINGKCDLAHFLFSCLLLNRYFENGIYQNDWI